MSRQPIQGDGDGYPYRNQFPAPNVDRDGGECGALGQHQLTRPMSQPARIFVSASPEGNAEQRF